MLCPIVAQLLNIRQIDDGTFCGSLRNILELILIGFEEA